MNHTLDTIAKRYSCRSFKDKMPEDKDLFAITQAAIQAPSGINRQHWQVILVKDRELINDMEHEGMSLLAAMEDSTMHERIMSRGGMLFYNAPCMIVIAIKEAYPKGAELIDLGIIAENIVLAATSLGIANIHCGFIAFAFAGNKAAEFKERLKFPEGYECGTSILLGYAEKETAPHVPDKSKITVIG